MYKYKITDTTDNSLEGTVVYLKEEALIGRYITIGSLTLPVLSVTAHTVTAGDSNNIITMSIK